MNGERDIQKKKRGNGYKGNYMLWRDIYYCYKLANIIPAPKNGGVHCVRYIFFSGWLLVYKIGEYNKGIMPSKL